MKATCYFLSFIFLAKKLYFCRRFIDIYKYIRKLTTSSTHSSKHLNFFFTLVDNAGKECNVNAFHFFFFFVCDSFRFSFFFLFLFSFPTSHFSLRPSPLPFHLISSFHFDYLKLPKPVPEKASQVV